MLDYLGHLLDMSPDTGTRQARKTLPDKRSCRSQLVQSSGNTRAW